jgi:hypothetical protein
MPAGCYDGKGREQVNRTDMERKEALVLPARASVQILV